MTTEELRQWMTDHAEEQYAEFQRKLLPENPREVIGVRMPLLRTLAKELAKDGAPLPEFGERHEEKLLEGLVTGLLKLPIEEHLTRIREYVGTIDNWALCDTFCSALRSLRRHELPLFRLAEEYCQRKETWEQRFGAVLLLTLFIRQSYLNRVLSLILHATPNGYYAEMGFGWALSMAIVQYPRETESILTNPRLDENVRRIGLRKAMESLRVTDEVKELVMRMRR